MKSFSSDSPLWSTMFLLRGGGTDADGNATFKDSHDAAHGIGNKQA